MYSCLIGSCHRVEGMFEDFVIFFVRDSRWHILASVLTIQLASLLLVYLRGPILFVDVCKYVD
jgi:hypothetical protein